MYQEKTGDGVGIWGGLDTRKREKEITFHRAKLQWLGGRWKGWAQTSAVLQPPSWVALQESVISYQLLSYNHDKHFAKAIKATSTLQELKSQVLNLLAGRDLLPEALTASTLIGL